MALYTLGVVMYSIPLHSLMFKKSCLYVAGFNETVCSDLEQQEKNIKNPVLGHASIYSTLRDVVQNVPAAVAAVIIGNYLTRYGFRTPLIVTLGGGVLTSVCHLLTVFYMPAPLLFNALADLPGSIAGGTIVISTAVYTNIATRVPESLRLHRMTTMSLCAGLPALIAIGSGAVLSEILGMKILLGLAAIILTIPAVMVIFFLEDIETPEENKNDSWREAFLLSLKNGLKTSIAVVSLKRPDGKRAQIISMIICIATSSIGIEACAGPLAFAYLKSVLKYTQTQYVVYTTFSMVLAFGALFPLVALTKLLKLSAPAMVSLGLAFFLAKFALLSLTEFDEIFFYVQILVGIPIVLTSLSARSHLTDLVDKAEVAVVMSLTSLSEKLLPLLSASLGTGIFAMTSSSFPGCFYLVISSIFIFPIVLSLYSTWIFRRSKRDEKNHTHL
ncbi:uncharacterized protein LOC100902388 [Galendromus occidentalis]|uniref:Uncharacterized protein LOC100902388 n=1 Tax=Galendromus occidentalis TaxID=34638 RepID=A0AAJ6QN19_9ACAR|nr:uncharacterized protein LOC100902388 [Galendromus occidentalis]